MYWLAAQQGPPGRAVRSRDGARRLDVARWGLVPCFTKDLTKARRPINARCETVAPSPLFKGSPDDLFKIVRLG